MQPRKDAHTHHRHQQQQQQAKEQQEHSDLQQQQQDQQQRLRHTQNHPEIRRSGTSVRTRTCRERSAVELSSQSAIAPAETVPAHRGREQLSHQQWQQQRPQLSPNGSSSRIRPPP
eukprot:GHVT01047896.1.p2 GENE.GHVT01047896.1~~GHVT01047896.1.p2  ORF type:complete len:116 (+),score=36.88 GHVT01047896.1:758-1105(+)